MGLYRQTARSAQPWRILLALLCVLLVAVGCTLQVAHAHADGSANHADCSLCVAAHSGVQVSATPAAVPAVHAVIAPVVPRVAAIQVLPVNTFALFTRPPPASLSPA